jgi:DNA-binding transcriptional regulator YiaG
MGHKAVMKSKPKVASTHGKLVHYKASKSHNFKNKLAPGKVGAYALPMSKTAHFHDAPIGLAYAEEPEATEVAGEEREAELASRLLDEISSESNDVNELCKRYGLKREELGRLTGFSLRALADWASDRLPSQPAKRRLHEIRRLLDALAQIVKPQSIPQWLHRPNQAFAPLTPLQVIELGEMDRLWAMIHDLASGQPE